jgi:hypothetical protein
VLSGRPGRRCVILAGAVLGAPVRLHFRPEAIAGFPRGGCRRRRDVGANSRIERGIDDTSSARDPAAPGAHRSQRRIGPPAGMGGVVWLQCRVVSGRAGHAAIAGHCGSAMARIGAMGVTSDEPAGNRLQRPGPTANSRNQAALPGSRMPTSGKPVRTGKTCLADHRGWRSRAGSGHTGATRTPSVGARARVQLPRTDLPAPGGPGPGGGGRSHRAAHRNRPRLHHSHGGISFSHGGPTSTTVDRAGRPEPPILDGSFGPWFEALEAAGRPLEGEPTTPRVPAVRGQRRRR